MCCLEFPMSSTFGPRPPRGAARRQLANAADFHCSCYVLPHDSAYCLRASSVKDYMQANLDVSRESRVTLYEKAEAPAEAAATNKLRWANSQAPYVAPLHA